MKNLIIFTSFVLKLFAEENHNLSLLFFQKDYHLVPEWYEVVSYDKKYVKELKTLVHKYNRTVATLNCTLTFNVDVGYDYEFVVQAYKFASNEYREFPMRMQFNYFQAVEQDLMGIGQLTKCGNFTGPFMKGITYHFCNWTPDDSKLPPYFPSGRYMLEMQALHKSAELFVTRAYVAVIRPEVRK